MKQRKMQEEMPSAWQIYNAVKVIESCIGLKQ
jgi:hypothetical protein